MAANTLSDEHRTAILSWLCDGKSNAEILSALTSTYGVTCSEPNLAHYRKKWQEEIDEAERCAVEAAKRRGYGSKARRVTTLCKAAEKLEKEVDYLNGSQIAKYGVGRELRDTFAAIAKELGQDAPAKIEVTGADGDAIKTQAEVFVTTDEHTAQVLGILAECGALAADAEAAPPPEA